MLLGKVDHTRREVTLILDATDVDDLSWACTIGADRAGDPDGLDHDKGAAHRLRILCALFSMAYETIKTKA